jgi:hypothetical protein
MSPARPSVAKGASGGAIIPDKGRYVKRKWNYKLLVSEKVGTILRNQVLK